MSGWSLKVISGGQVGADVAALRAARRAGLPTGGAINRGFKTRRGPHPELAAFGLVELPSDLYPDRTRANVTQSDGTLRFARDWRSRGERCTLNCLLAVKRPYHDVTVPDGPVEPADVALCRFWLLAHDIHTLNVAGNATEEIEPYVEAFLGLLFESLRGETLP